MGLGIKGYYVNWNNFMSLTLKNPNILSAATDDFQIANKQFRQLSDCSPRRGLIWVYILCNLVVQLQQQSTCALHSDLRVPQQE